MLYSLNFILLVSYLIYNRLPKVNHITLYDSTFILYSKNGLCCMIIKSEVYPLLLTTVMRKIYHKLYTVQFEIHLAIVACRTKSSIIQENKEKYYIHVSKNMQFDNCYLT